MDPVMEMPGTALSFYRNVYVKKNRGRWYLQRRLLAAESGSVLRLFRFAFLPFAHHLLHAARPLDAQDETVVAVAVELVDGHLRVAAVREADKRVALAAIGEAVLR